VNRHPSSTTVDPPAGKHPVDAVNDPDLNLQIQAWEMMSPGAAVDFWGRCYHQTPSCS
jgi:hypothetical protein